MDQTVCSWGEDIEFLFEIQADMFSDLDIFKFVLPSPLTFIIGKNNRKISKYCI